MADLRLVVFGQTGHFHDGIAVNAVLQHGTGNFMFAFFNTTLFTLLDALLNTLLFELLCDGHDCISVLRHTLWQFAYAVSLPSGYFWLRHNLENFKKRLIFIRINIWSSNFLVMVFVHTLNSTNNGSRFLV